MHRLNCAGFYGEKPQDRIFDSYKGIQISNWYEENNNNNIIYCDLHADEKYWRNRSFITSNGHAPEWPVGGADAAAVCDVLA